jgi:hypothetical protein
MDAGIAALFFFSGTVIAAAVPYFTNRANLNARAAERAEDRADRLAVATAAEQAAGHAKAASEGIKSIAEDMKALEINTNNKMDQAIAAIKEGAVSDVARAGAEGELRGRQNERDIANQRERGNC